jgi:hypothetical protein
MITYTQQKEGLSYVHDKRLVLSDGVSTLTLPIENKINLGDLNFILNNLLKNIHIIIYERKIKRIIL